MSKTQPALTKRPSSRLRAALAAAVAFASVFGSHAACSETAGIGAAPGTMRTLADAYDNIQPDFAFDIVPTNQMARIKGAAGTLSLPLMLPENRPLVALPIEGVKSSVKTLADGIYPHFSIVTEGANSAAALRLNASVHMPDGGRIVIEIAQRVPNTGAPATAR